METQHVVCSPSVESGCYGGRVIATVGGPEPLSRLGGVLPCVRTCLLLRDFPPVGHMAPMPQNFPPGCLGNPPSSPDPECFSPGPEV